MVITLLCQMRNLLITVGYPFLSYAMSEKHSTDMLQTK